MFKNYNLITVRNAAVAAYAAYALCHEEVVA